MGPSFALASMLHSTCDLREHRKKLRKGFGKSQLPDALPSMSQHGQAAPEVSHQSLDMRRCVRKLAKPDSESIQNAHSSMATLNGVCKHIALKNIASEKTHRPICQTAQPLPSRSRCSVGFRKRSTRRTCQNVLCLVLCLRQLKAMNVAWETSQSCFHGLLPFTFSRHKAKTSEGFHVLQFFARFAPSLRLRDPNGVKQRRGRRKAHGASGCKCRGVSRDSREIRDSEIPPFGRTWSGRWISIFGFQQMKGQHMAIIRPGRCSLTESSNPVNRSQHSAQAFTWLTLKGEQKNVAVKWGFPTKPQ